MFAGLREDGAENPGNAGGMTANPVETTCRGELQQYRMVASMPFNKSNYVEQAHQVLAWWEENKGRFPTLYVLAMHFLAIPATEAPSERLFSLGSRIITKLRN